MTELLAPSLTMRPIDAFSEAREVWPRGDRLAALRDAAVGFRSTFRQTGQVRAVRTVDIAAAAYPRAFAFHGAAFGINPYVSIVNRLLIVQYDDLAGKARTLVWEPTVPAGVAEAPFYAQLIERYGEFLSHKVFAKYWHTVEEALALHGLSRGDVDVAAFDHLHVQDMRYLLGTTRPVEGEAVPREPAFPNAVFLSQSREVDTLRSVHPMQWAWYVPNGITHAREDAHLEIDGDVLLGQGVAILSTPGHTDGNQTLVLNTPEGIWVSSENGVSADNWQPELSRIPGVRKTAAFYRREVVLNANTQEDPLDQYDSMVVEKTLASPSTRDRRWLNILPSSELAAWKRQWPVIPTFVQGGITTGAIVSSSSTTR